MRIVCAGCGADLGTKTSLIHDDEATSHSLCASCAHHFRATAGMPFEQYIEGLEAPVVTVTPQGTIATANAIALELLGKSPTEIMGFNGGDVFECEYARLPEGCGETVHCSGCTIRNTVMDTLQTGTPHRREPAYLNRYSDRGSQHYDLLISTEKKGGVVFLTIEEMTEAKGSGSPDGE